MKKLGKNALANLTLNNTMCRIDLGSIVTAVDISNYNDKILWGVNSDNPILNNETFRDKKYTVLNSTGINLKGTDNIANIDYTKVVGNKVILQYYPNGSISTSVAAKTYYSTNNPDTNKEDKEARSGINKVFIPYGVVSLRNTLFAYTAIESIDIPDTVTSITANTFKGCIQLKNIKLSNALTELKSYAFSGCVGLESITIPSSVQVIDANVFANCTNLKTITVKKSADSIENAPWGATNAEIIWEE